MRIGSRLKKKKKKKKIKEAYSPVAKQIFLFLRFAKTAQVNLQQS